MKRFRGPVLLASGLLCFGAYALAAAVGAETGGLTPAAEPLAAASLALGVLLALSGVALGLRDWLLRR